MPIGAHFLLLLVLLKLKTYVLHNFSFFYVFFQNHLLNRKFKYSSRTVFI